jgi:hypothetical protein
MHRRGADTGRKKGKESTRAATGRNARRQYRGRCVAAVHIRREAVSRSAVAVVGQASQPNSGNGRRQRSPRCLVAAGPRTLLVVACSLPSLFCLSVRSCLLWCVLARLFRRAARASQRHPLAVIPTPSAPDQRSAARRGNTVTTRGPSARATGRPAFPCAFPVSASLALDQSYQSDGCPVKAAGRLSPSLRRKGRQRRGVRRGARLQGCGGPTGTGGRGVKRPEQAGEQRHWG